MTKTRTCLLAGAGLLCLGRPVFATTYAVQDVSALRQAALKAQAGDQINLAPGQYDLDGSGGPLSLNQPGGTLAGTGRPDQVTLSLSNGAAIQVQAPGWRIQHLTLRGTIGVQVSSGSSGVTLDGLRVLGGQQGIVLGNIGDLVCSLSGVVLSNNVIAGFSVDGIEINSGCDVQIYFQTVWGGARPLVVQGVSKAPLTSDNIWSAAIQPPGQGDLVLSSTSASSWFANTGGYDFHLSTGAAPIGRGVAVPSVTQDADGNPRPATMPDVGAYQYVIGGADGGLDGGGNGAVSGGPSVGGGAPDTPPQMGSLSCAVSDRPRPAAGPSSYLLLLGAGLLRLGRGLARRGPRQHRQPL